MTLFQIIYFLIIMVMGVVLLVTPITAMRFLALWPKFIIPKVLREEDVPQRTREAMRLIDRDSEEYSRRFWYQLLILRISGAIMLIIVALAVLFSMAASSPRV